MHGDEGFLDLEGAHWSFALELYQQPGVSRACLLLQDVLGADVCLLLFALFVARQHGTILDKEDLEELERAIGDWRDEVVRPLRSLRRRLKSGPPPAPVPATDALRQRISAAEINAEQIELALLAQHFNGSGRAMPAGAVAICTALDQTVSFFAARAGREVADLPEVPAALQDIARALARS